MVPDNWRGIQHIEPLHIDTLSTLPLSLKPKARSVNPALYANAKLEFDRLKGYFYIDSVSPYASCLVIAPKKTPPYIRICGDYRVINQHIRSTHAPIPNVLNEIMRIAKYRVFADLDMTNSFHQIPLDSHSQLLLSIQTIWGQVQPLFLPEGVKPASGALQDIVRHMFGHLEYVIVIFDNILVLANDLLDAYSKFCDVMDICVHFNVQLKLSKCHVGVTEVEFFGYKCSFSKYGLTDARKIALTSIPFPKNVRESNIMMIL